jgi:hypothetical protein
MRPDYPQSKRPRMKGSDLPGFVAHASRVGATAGMRGAQLRAATKRPAIASETICRTDVGSRAGCGFSR